jgi:hypothetical protein
VYIESISLFVSSLPSSWKSSSTFSNLTGSHKSYIRRWRPSEFVDSELVNNIYMCHHEDISIRSSVGDCWYSSPDRSRTKNCPFNRLTTGF